MQVDVQTLKVGFVHHLCKRAHLFRVSKSRWSPSLGAFVALKIDRNGVEVRKL
jgi:hypothetical protein